MATIEALVAIDEDFNSKTLVSGYYRTYFIMLHENRIYVSYETSGSPLRINVYGLTGQPISEWVGKDNGNFSRPAIVSNQIVVPDTRNQQLTVYSLSGETLRYISNFQLTGDIGRSSSICTADKNCIIVSTMVSSQISKINITTGEAVWTSNDIVNPQAVAIYGKNYVCVGSERKISFLNVNTGLIFYFSNVFKFKLISCMFSIFLRI